MFRIKRITILFMSALLMGSTVCTPIMAAEASSAVQEEASGEASSAVQEEASGETSTAAQEEQTKEEPASVLEQATKTEQPESEKKLPLIVVDGVTDVSQKDSYNASAAWDAEKLASLPVLDTDVTSASDGCVMLGLPGEYIADQQAVLDRINEIRREACEEGVTNPETNMPLTPNDYVPLKWSNELEKIARIRAAESSMTGYHQRTNGSSWQSMDSEFTYVGECIAWNYSSSATSGIDQWYNEKKYWLEGNAEDSGHYTTLIRPAMRCVGSGTFYSPYTEYPNTTLVEFGTNDGVDQSFADIMGECIQMLEVPEARLDGNPSIIGTLSGVKDDEHILLLTTDAVYNGPVFTANTKSLLFEDGVNWSSSDSGIASVSASGIVKAGKCGSASITAQAENGTSAAAEFIVDHVLQKIPAVDATCTETGLTEGEKCSNCGKVTIEQKEVPAKGHNWSSWRTVKEATCTAKGSREKNCTVCGSKVTEETPAAGHKWNSYYTVDKAATYTSEGSKSKHCSVCGASDPDSVQSIPKLKAGWKKNSTGWWYDRGDGTYPSSKFETIGGKVYYFNSYGYMVTGWREIDGKWYYFSGSGAMVTGFQQVGSKWYHFNTKGVMHTGWQKLDGKWYYFSESGAMVTRWQEIDGQRYYFNSRGVMQTGWQELDGKWYYLNRSGVMLTHWQEIDGKRYYFSSRGVMLTGWQEIGGRWYYFSESGAMRTGWQKLDGARYYFNGSGIMQTGWQQIEGKWYFFRESGAAVTGWQEISGRWYYFSGSGTMRTGWQKLDGTWYYLNRKGAMVTGWQLIDGKWYYFSRSGAMRTGWQQIDGVWYYLDSIGEMQTGWQEIDGKWYYFSRSGAMQIGWHEIGSNWYYLNSKGVMVAGWLLYKDNWYYLSSSGAMLTGWQKIDGIWYYLDGSGAMAANKWVGDYYLTESGAMAEDTWIGEFYVGPDGKWIPGYLREE